MEQLAHRGLAEVAASRVASCGDTTRVDQSRRDYTQISNKALRESSETALQPLREPNEATLLIRLNELP